MEKIFSEYPHPTAMNNKKRQLVITEIESNKRYRLEQPPANGNVKLYFRFFRCYMSEHVNRRIEFDRFQDIQRRLCLTTNPLYRGVPRMFSGFAPQEIEMVKYICLLRRVCK